MKRRRNINKNRKKSHSPLLVSLAQWYVCLLSWPYLGLDSYGSSILVEYPWQIFFFFYEIDISWVISFYILIFMILHMTCKHIVVHWCWGLSPVYLNVTLILIHYSCKVFLHIILTKWLDVFFFFCLKNIFLFKTWGGGYSSLLDMVKSCRKFVITDVLMPIFSGLL